MKDSSKQHNDNTEQVCTQLDSMQRDLITALNKDKTNTPQGHSDILNILHGIKSKLEDLAGLDNVAKRANKILGQLWFPDMLAREALVDNPVGKSYCWILQPPTKERESSRLSYEKTDRKLDEEKSEQETTRGHFNRWLTSESGVFYISGKNSTRHTANEC